MMRGAKGEADECFGIHCRRIEMSDLVEQAAVIPVNKARVEFKKQRSMAETMRAKSATRFTQTQTDNAKGTRKTWSGNMAMNSRKQVSRYGMWLA